MNPVYNLQPFGSRTFSELCKIKAQDHLRTASAEPVIDLHTLLDRVYDRVGYTVAIDYQNDPLPPLETEDTEWMNVILQTQR